MEIRGHVINVAQQKAQMRRPVPMDVGSMDAEDEYGRWWSSWEPEVDAIDRSGVKCYACGGLGHIANHDHHQEK